MKTKEKIITSSLQLFNEHGERNITTNHIAAHLGISPGNLYYHFRNKEDIIRSIFDEYEAHLNNILLPYENSQVNLELLMGYFDAMFDTLWRYRFIYANLVDLLSRDPKLKLQYQKVQKALLARSIYILSQLVEDRFLSIDKAQISAVAETIKMLVSFWISFQYTQSENEKITQNALYDGLLRVLLLLRPYATELSASTFVSMEQHYQSLVSL